MLTRKCAFVQPVQEQNGVVSVGKFAVPKAMKVYTIFVIKPKIWYIRTFKSSLR